MSTSFGARFEIFHSRHGCFTSCERGRRCIERRGTTMGPMGRAIRCETTGLGSVLYSTVLAKWARKKARLTEQGTGAVESDRGRPSGGGLSGSPRRRPAGRAERLRTVE